MTRSRSDYTEEEIDAVIDYFDLSFMRNKLKASDPDLLQLMHSFGGGMVVLSLRTRKLGRAIYDALRGRA